MHLFSTSALVCSVHIYHIVEAKAEHNPSSKGKPSAWQETRQGGIIMHVDCHLLIASTQFRSQKMGNDQATIAY